MKLTRPLLAKLSFALAATTLAALPAVVFPTRAEAQVVTQADRCRAELGKSARRYLDRVVKARIKCENKVVDGELPLATDCILGRGDDQLNKALLKAEARLSNIGANCNGVSLQTLGFPGVCPDNTGFPFDTGDFQECVVDRSDAMVEILLDAYYPPVLERLRGNIALCLKGAPDDAAKSLSKKMRARERCLVGKDYGTMDEDVDCRAKILPYGPGTGNGVVDKQVARSYQALLGTVPVACADIQIDDLDYQSICPDSTGGVFTVFDLKKCFFDVNRFTAMQELETVWPSAGSCGDGTVNPGEECDLGTGNSNTLPNTCRLNCTNPRCTDGVQDTGEQCDDGNTNDADCCSNTCAGPVCGDGNVGCGEECDDGPLNANLPDKCRASGEFACEDPKCGDEIQDSIEECDDGNTASEDGCSMLCFEERCGDEIVQAGLGEECDNGIDNANLPDQCRATGEFACQDPQCGDEIVDTGETCDDGNTVSGDGCDAGCAFCGDDIKAPGEQCDGSDEPCGAGGTCNDSCMCVAVCGDDIKAPSEECDGSNDPCLAAGESCTEECMCVVDCGDGIKAPSEECDGSSASCGAGEACTGTCTCEEAVSGCPDVGELVLYSGVGQDCATNAECPVGTCDQSLGGKCRTVTQLDSGWTGGGHRSDINDIVTTRGTLSCDSVGPVCGECDVTGIDPEPRNCRCANATRTVCDQPFVADADDCGGAICNCYFGAPFPLTALGTSVCVVNRFTEQIRGKANVDLGSGTISAKLRAQVFGQYLTNYPCPTCGGTCSNSPSTFCDRDEDCTGGTCTLDAIANDGVRGGICNPDAESNDQGLPCDVMGFNTSFPAYPTGKSGGGYSLDCLPSPGTTISGTGLIINLTQTTGTSTLAAQLPCVDNQDYLCPCAVCSTDTSLPCNVDADCSVQQGGCSLASGAQEPFLCTSNNDCSNRNAGTCQTLIGACRFATSILCSTNSDCTNVDVGDCNPSTCSKKGAGSGGTIPAPNKCIDQLCDADGECTVGPDEQYCAGVLKANGTGILACQSDEGCTENGFDARPCGLIARQACFPDPIVAVGDPDPSTPIGASTFCVPPSTNGAVNDVAGLPGPGKVVNQAKARTFCASDPTHTKEYIPGVGGCLEP